jgi:hypothetical protein
MAIYFTFPIVANIWILGIFDRNPGAGFMVCLHVYTKKQIRRGLYFEDEELKWDGIGDWQKIWGPLESVLIKGLECRSPVKPSSATTDGGGKPSRKSGRKQ